VHSNCIYSERLLDVTRARFALGTCRVNARPTDSTCGPVDAVVGRLARLAHFWRRDEAHERLVEPIWGRESLDRGLYPATHGPRNKHITNFQDTEVKLRTRNTFTTQGEVVSVYATLLQ
jgi:hypothetical protein